MIVGKTERGVGKKKEWKREASNYVTVLTRTRTSVFTTKNVATDLTLILCSLVMIIVHDDIVIYFILSRATETFIDSNSLP